MEEDRLYHEIDKYSTLLKKSFEGKLDTGERRELAKWLWSSRENRDLSRKICDGRSLGVYRERVSGIDETYEFKLLVQRCPRLAVNSRKIIPVWRYTVAAAVACLLVIGGWLLSREPEVPEKIVVAETSLTRAILTTADGKVVVLQEGENETLVNDAGSFEVNDSIKELVYTEQSGEKESVGFHKLEIPRGGEYNLVLPDGTFVRLNSESSIRFPEKFNGKFREIEVSGEVYFKVAKDAEHPFVARAGEYRTEVLGTHFGMRVFPGEEEWSTVLEEGKVKVSYGSGQVVLEPGEKAYLEQRKLKSCPVDVEKELAWVDGLFVFKHDRLERVVKELSRWYHVEFLFSREELKDYLFTGEVKRDLGVDEILSLIERMNVVKFSKNKEYIVVEKNDKVKNRN